MRMNPRILVVAAVATVASMATVVGAATVPASGSAQVGSASTASAVGPLSEGGNGWLWWRAMQKKQQKSDPTPAPVETDACGERPAKTDGTRWSCTFVDDFDGDSLDRTKWMPQTQFSSGENNGALACYFDDPDNVAVADGNLLLTTRKVVEPRPCHAGAAQETTQYTAGMVSTFYLFSQRYGRFEAKIKNEATDQPGLQEAFWLWPDVREGYTDIWPAAGEIDIAETYSQHPQLAIPFLHYTWYDNWGPVPGLNTAWDCAAERGVYNTYTLEWSAQRLEIFVNGKSCLVNTTGDSAFQKKYIVALTSMLGTGANGYTGAAPLPATMAVDYVRVWE